MFLRGSLLFPSLPLPPPFPSLPFTSPSPLSAPLLSPSLSLPSPPLEIGPLKIQLRGLGERCKLPSGVWGGAPAEIEFGAF